MDKIDGVRAVCDRFVAFMSFLDRLNLVCGTRRQQIENIIYGTATTSNGAEVQRLRAHAIKSQQDLRMAMIIEAAKLKQEAAQQKTDAARLEVEADLLLQEEPQDPKLPSVTENSTDNSSVLMPTKQRSKPPHVGRILMTATAYSLMGNGVMALLTLCTAPVLAFLVPKHAAQVSHTTPLVTGRNGGSPCL